ncbi:MAG: ComEA family DNA-binding protein [Promicromonosporaceae bacterium]|nr:ComEA family DNA-binding protein [Promicromonosporaceae bacterium]
MSESLEVSLERLRLSRLAAEEAQSGVASGAVSGPTDLPASRLAARRLNSASTLSAEAELASVSSASAGSQRPGETVPPTGVSPLVEPKPRIGLTFKAALAGVLALLALGGGVVSARFLTTMAQPLPITSLGETEHSTEIDSGWDSDWTVPPEQPEPVPQQVVVHVAGQVHVPGVVTLPSGSRVADAVALAGGATGEAELAAINLARILVDGEQIIIPAQGQPVEEPAAPPPPEEPSINLTEVPDESGRINLNHAGSALLQQLPGIGPALAERIIEHRNATGGFTNPEQLQDVPGIGPAIMANVRDRITV